MLKTINFTTQTPYTKGVQQPQNQNFATAPHVILKQQSCLSGRHLPLSHTRVILNSFQNLITRPKYPYSSQPHKDVFVKTAQPSFKGKELEVPESFSEEVIANAERAARAFLSGGIHSKPATARAFLMRIPPHQRSETVNDLIKQANNAMNPKRKR